MEFFPLILLALAFVLLIVMPARQRKRVAAQQQQMQEALTPGTPIMTTSGIHGTVVGKTDTTVDVEIAPGVVVTFVRQAILEVRTPAGGALTADDAADATPGENSPGADGGSTDTPR
ncbi:preprotein translocase subunit YajC [Trujillonella endophytica]|uniref:Preprotein translocase subunit YajC n=1 Tax=Trujillonella endophytica TaxID=673521 RepID=A0A1H8TZS4_9ACTN|nr:preprotein translocase subunit YajC [Trujillella endophytica]SEO95918.1 preprotein translocase subunit YajC [Trujillella endophytica]